VGEPILERPYPIAHLLDVAAKRDREPIQHDIEPVGESFLHRTDETTELTFDLAPHVDQPALHLDAEGLCAVDECPTTRDEVLQHREPALRLLLRLCHHNLLPTSSVVAFRPHAAAPSAASTPEYWWSRVVPAPGANSAPLKNPTTGT